MEMSTFTFQGRVPLGVHTLELDRFLGLLVRSHTLRGATFPRDALENRYCVRIHDSADPCVAGVVVCNLHFYGLPIDARLSYSGFPSAV